MSQTDDDCKHSKYKLCFKLKQHTPIIHFQATEKGATLRASELKPKLDRFLIKELKLTEIIQVKGENKEVPKENYKSWFIGEGKKHLALDYKVKIEEDSSGYIDISKLYIDLYFAGRKPRRQTEKEEFEWERTKKRFKENYEPIKIIFVSMHVQLNMKIAQYFTPFIFQTNFGTRQSKGFGSFGVIGISPLLMPDILYSFNAKSKKDAFKKIHYFYKFIRSGINELKKEKDATKEDKPKHIFYAKSLLWLYAKNKKWTWDKRIIKKDLLADTSDYKRQNKIYNDNSDIFSYEGEEKYLIKDTLGLSSEELWLSYRKTIVKENTNKDKEGNPVIKRFKSPIIFKPIKQSDDSYLICFWGENIPKMYLENKFKIYLKGEINKNTELGLVKDFDINNFLKFVYIFAKKRCIKKHIDDKFHVDPPNGFKKPNNYNPSNYYKVLGEVLNSIKKESK